MPRSYAWYTMIKTEELITVREVGFPLFFLLHSLLGGSVHHHALRVCIKGVGGFIVAKRDTPTYVLRDNSMMNRHPLFFYGCTSPYSSWVIAAWR